MEEEVYSFQSAKDKTMPEAAQVADAKTMSYYCKCVKATSHILVVTFTCIHSIQSFHRMYIAHFNHSSQDYSIETGESQASVIHTIGVHMRLHHVQIQQLKKSTTYT